MIKVYYLTVPNPQQSLAKFAEFIESNVVSLSKYLPKVRGQTSFRPAKEDGTQPSYNEDWVSPRVKIPLSEFVPGEKGFLGMEMHWHASKSRPLKGQDNRPIILSGNLEDNTVVFDTIQDPNMAEFLTWVSHPTITINDLPQILTNYGEAQSKLPRAIPQKLAELGVTKTVNVPTDRHGMSLHEPVQPLRKYQ